MEQREAVAVKGLVVARVKRGERVVVPRRSQSRELLVRENS
jgi:hypothetical protein